MAGTARPAPGERGPAGKRRAGQRDNRHHNDLLRPFSAHGDNARRILARSPFAPLSYSQPEPQPFCEGAEAREALAAMVALDVDLCGTSALVQHPCFDPAAFKALRQRDYAATMLPVVWLANGRFEFRTREPDDPALIVELRDASDEAIVDLLAVDPDQPERTATLLGRTVWIDEWSARAHPATRGGRPLRLHRHALAWMAAGCTGAVLFNIASAWTALADVPGPILVPDRAYGHDLARACRGFIPIDKIRVPRDGR